MPAIEIEIQAAWHLNRSEVDKTEYWLAAQHRVSQLVADLKQIVEDGGLAVDYRSIGKAEE
jgi:hypothetical protein